MSEQIRDGGLAFPIQVHVSPNSEVHYGMSLRDWFAGQALAGILTSDEKSEMGLSDVVESAFEIADAMLERRGK